MKRDFYSSWPEESRGACMEYLHGIVIDDEFEAACFYEYARESAILRDAAAERDRLLRQGRKNPFEEVAQHIDQKHNPGPWFYQLPWYLIWRCRSFSGKPWNQISKRKRADILQGFTDLKIHPLHMTEIMELDAIGLFEEFKAMAAEASKTRTNLEPRLKVFPMLDARQLSFADSSAGLHWTARGASHHRPVKRSKRC